MGRNRENTRHSHYVIRIVCEGEKTEPLFFTSLCNEYYKGNETVDVRTVPQPHIPLDEGGLITSRGCYKGKRRKVKRDGDEPDEEVVITGAPPLKWVLYARQILSEGVDESWAVYDKDEHPKHEEAMAEAAKVIDGKCVNIAFSSRSFEYYLLLHFDYIYYAFNETECGEKIKGNKLLYECGTGKYPENDCYGKTCINGYARKQGYWQVTKSSESTYTLVKDKLVKGMVNACRLRDESNAKTSKPVYDRNPYTNVDLLVGRLIGKETVSYDNAYTYTLHGRDWSVKFSADCLSITNGKGIHEVYGKGMFAIYDWEENKEWELNDKNILLHPNETCKLPCRLEPTQVISVKISSEKEVLLLPKFDI